LRANEPDAEGRVVRAFVCIDSRDWEEVSRSAARYLREGEAILAHVVDERAPRGYDLAIRGLLGRRDRRSEEEMAAVSEAAAGELLADAENLLKQLRPELNVRSVVLKGSPNEELIDAANAAEAQTIFIGRGTPGSRPQLSVSGTVRGWKENRHGDQDGLYLEDGTEVGFPPHRAREIQSLIREGRPISALGTWHGRRFHAYTITDSDSGTRTEAHKFPGEGPGKMPLGHTARFVVDHALCDVTLLRL
jgi:nucleotide-binding universal stress UspA family protein